MTYPVPTTTLATVIATLMLATASAQAGDMNVRTFSPSVELHKDYRLNQHTDTRIDNSRRSWVNRKNYRYNYSLDHLNANQTYNQKRTYSSRVSQGAANNAGNQGHVMGQQQGGTQVTTRSADTRNHVQGGVNLLSPSHSQHGTAYKGNFELYGSQIGANQSGFQGGDNTNLQHNQQTQYGAARTGSRDILRNGNRN